MTTYRRRTRWWIVALAFLSVALVGCSPPSTPSFPRSEFPVDPWLGVHTRLTDEPDEEKIARTMFLVREMGAGAVTEFFPWAYLQPEPGQWDWDHVDLVVREAERQGLKLYARLDHVPTWARPHGSPVQLLEQKHVADYVAAVAEFAARYEGRLAGIIVWNEPNLSNEWGFRPVSPADYVNLLQHTYLAIKERAPTVWVYAAGLAPTFEESGNALADAAFLEQMYLNGAARWFDALAAHSYGWVSPTHEEPARDRINFRRLELLREVMVRNGDAGKSILLTESGWNDHPRWTKAVRPAQRVRYTLDAMQYAEQAWPWLEGLHFWHFRLPRPSHNYNDSYTFVGVDFVPKPIYWAVRDAAHHSRAPEGLGYHDSWRP